MPSKPLLGSPVAVGISDAVMAIRSVVSAMAVERQQNGREALACRKPYE